MAIGHAGSFSSGGGATGGGGNVDTRTGLPTGRSSAPSSPVPSSPAPSSSPVGSADWYAAEIASREATAAATTVSSPGTANLGSPSGGTYTDPRTGMTFATESIAASLGYGAPLSVGGRTDPYAQAVAALPTRSEQELYLSRNVDPYNRADIGVRLADQAPATSMAAAYLNRPDVFKVTDAKQLSLMESEGLTSYQAAERLRYEAQKKNDFRGENYYENLRTQAWTTATGKSAGYHAWAKDTGLPQAANPYEYTADLFTYAEKGYPTQSKDVFSPINYEVLGLADGKGGQDFVWGNKSYDLRGAMDVVAKAERGGKMGAYGTLGSYSSAYGAGGGFLPLSMQQSIGAQAAESRGEKVSYTQWGQTPEQMGVGKYVSSIPEAPFDISKMPAPFRSAPNDISKMQAPFRSTPESITTTEKPSEEWIRGVPLVGGLLAGTGIFKKTSEISEPMGSSTFASPVKYQQDLLKSLVTTIAPTTITTEITSQPRDILRSELPTDRGATFTPTFIDPIANKPSQTFESEGMLYDMSKVSVQSKQSFVSEGKSPFTKWEQGLTSWMPPSEVGEAAVRRVSLLNPVTQSTVAQGYLSEFIADTFMPSRSQEVREQNMMVEGLVGMRGQYTQFKESPTMTVTSFGAGIVLGGVTRGAVTAYPYLLKASGSGLVRKGIETTAKTAPYILAGLYGADILGRGTDYGTAVDYRSTGRIKAIVMQETIPMGLGMMVGYSPLRTATKAYDKAGDKIWEYRQRASGVTKGQGTGPIWEEPIITGGGRYTPSGGTPRGGAGGYTGGYTDGYTAPSRGGYTPGGSTAPLRSDGTVSPARIFSDVIEGRVSSNKFFKYEAAYKMRTYSENYARTGNVKFKEYADLYSGLKPKGDIINPYTGAIEYRTGARGGMEYFPSAPKASTTPGGYTPDPIDLNLFASKAPTMAQAPKVMSSRVIPPKVTEVPKGAVATQYGWETPGRGVTGEYAFIGKQVVDKQGFPPWFTNTLKANAKASVKVSASSASSIIPLRSPSSVVPSIRTKATGFDKEISLYGGAGQLSARRGGQLTVGWGGQLATRQTGQLAIRRAGELTTRKPQAIERYYGGGLKIYEPGGKVAVSRPKGELTIARSFGELTPYERPGKITVIERPGKITVTERPWKIIPYERIPPPKVIDPIPKVIDPIPKVIDPIPKVKPPLPGGIDFGGFPSSGGGAGGYGKGSTSHREYIPISSSLDRIGFNMFGSRAPTRRKKK